MQITLKYPPQTQRTVLKIHLTYVVLSSPYRWQEADGVLFPVVQYKRIIYLYQKHKGLYGGVTSTCAEPFDVEAYIAAPSPLMLNYSRTIYWGYNE